MTWTEKFESSSPQEIINYKKHFRMLLYFKHPLEGDDAEFMKAFAEYWRRKK